MATFALFVLAAILFSLLAGAIESVLARHGRRQALLKSSPILHPLTRHGFQRLRSVGARRGLHHVELFLVFLVVTYAGMVVLRAVHGFLNQWLSP